MLTFLHFLLFLKFLGKIVKLFYGFSLTFNHFTQFTARISKAMRFLNKPNRPFTIFSVFSCVCWYKISQRNVYRFIITLNFCRLTHFSLSWFLSYNVLAVSGLYCIIKTSANFATFSPNVVCYISPLKNAKIVHNLLSYFALVTATNFVRFSRKQLSKY